MSEITHKKADQIRHRNKTLFISLPMNGRTKSQIRQRLLDISRQAIHLACAKFGWDENDVWWESSVENAVVEIGECKNNRLLYLGKAIEQLAYVDAVYFDEGWVNAKGCNVERYVALKYGIPIVDYNEYGISWELTCDGKVENVEVMHSGEESS